MRNYPYFISDALILLVLLFIVPAVSIYLGNLVMGLMSILFFALVFQSSIRKIKDFERSIEGIKGIRSWESDFSSLGTLVFDYKGERLRYHSVVRGKDGGNIPVDYLVDARNGSKKRFEILNKGEGWLNEFYVSGDKRFLSSVKREISAFNKKYMISEMRNSDGFLHISVSLQFLPGKPPSKEKKLGDMAGFLEEYLEFAYKLNRKLRE